MPRQHPLQDQSHTPVYRSTYYFRWSRIPSLWNSWHRRPSLQFVYAVRSDSRRHYMKDADRFNLRNCRHFLHRRRCKRRYVLSWTVVCSGYAIISISDWKWTHTRKFRSGREKNLLLWLQQFCLDMLSHYLVLAAPPITSEWVSIAIASKPWLIVR